MTLKIYDGVYAHKDIVESGKDHKDITSLLRLGKTLTIDKETFEDLDEVSASISFLLTVFLFVMMIAIPFHVMIAIPFHVMIM